MVTVLLAALTCLTLSVEPAHVKKVIDGDTLVLYHVGIPTEERVRVLGIDTPERGQPNYPEAAQFTTEWLHAGPFDLKSCKRDSFGRLLAEVSRNGVSLGDDLMKAGLAVPWRKQQ